MGGAGKTQLALKFAELNKNRFVVLAFIVLKDLGNIFFLEY